MNALMIVDNTPLARRTWRVMSPTQQRRLCVLADAHAIWGDACATGLKGSNVAGTLRVLFELSVVERFCGHGGFVRLRPTPYGYTVLEHAGWRPPRAPRVTRTPGEIQR